MNPPRTPPSQPREPVGLRALAGAGDDDSTLTEMRFPVE